MNKTVEAKDRYWGNKKLNSMLQNVMQAKKIKQIELAQLIGITQARLSNYLLGKRKFSLEIMCKLADVLDIDLNVLKSFYLDKSVSYDTALTLTKSDGKNSLKMAHEPLSYGKLSKLCKLNVKLPNPKEVDIFLVPYELIDTTSDITVFEALQEIKTNKVNIRRGDFVFTIRLDSDHMAEEELLLIKPGRNPEICSIIFTTNGNRTYSYLVYEYSHEGKEPILISDPKMLNDFFIIKAIYNKY